MTHSLNTLRLTGNLLELRSLGPIPGLLNQNLHFNTIPRSSSAREAWVPPGPGTAAVLLNSIFASLSVSPLSRSYCFPPFLPCSGLRGGADRLCTLQRRRIPGPIQEMLCPAVCSSLGIPKQVFKDQRWKRWLTPAPSAPLGLCTCCFRFLDYLVLPLALLRANLSSQLKYHFSEGSLPHLPQRQKFSTLATQLTCLGSLKNKTKQNTKNSKNKTKQKTMPGLSQWDQNYSGWGLGTPFFL